jgi:hypothetical protein
MDVKINYVAVALAAFCMWAIGAVWYTSLSAPWMMYVGVTEEMGKNVTTMDIIRMYGGSMIAFAVTFYVQSHIHHAFQVKDVKGATTAAFWSWLGFVAMVTTVNNLYQMKSFMLTLIDSGYWLIGMVVGGMILVKMQKK